MNNGIKKYNNPEIEVVELASADVITASSQGTETPRQEESGGSWG